MVHHPTYARATTAASITWWASAGCRQHTACSLPPMAPLSQHSTIVTSLAVLGAESNTAQHRQMRYLKAVAASCPRRRSIHKVKSCARASAVLRPPNLAASRQHAARALSIPEPSQRRKSRQQATGSGDYAHKCWQVGMHAHVPWRKSKTLCQLAMQPTAGAALVACKAGQKVPTAKTHQQQQRKALSCACGRCPRQLLCSLSHTAYTHKPTTALS